jgi:hypothetical protein
MKKGALITLLFVSFLGTAFAQEEESNKKMKLSKEKKENSSENKKISVSGQSLMGRARTKLSLPPEGFDNHNYARAMKEENESDIKK